MKYFRSLMVLFSLCLIMGCDESEGTNTNTDTGTDTGDDHSCHFLSCSGSSSSGASFRLECYGSEVTSWSCNEYTNGLGQITTLSCNESPGFVSVTCHIDYDISGNPSSGSCSCPLAETCTW